MTGSYIKPQILGLFLFICTIRDFVANLHISATEAQKFQNVSSLLCENREFICPECSWREPKLDR